MAKPYDIRERTFEFAMAILELVERIPQSRAGNCVANQIVRSGTSVGANIEEAAGGSSKRDFINRTLISLREARETNYWLRIIKKKRLAPEKETEDVLSESEELKKNLGTIVSSSRNTRKK